MKQKHAGNSYKKVPLYWWDFENDCREIVIQSDHKDWPVLAYLMLENRDNGADKEIEMATQIIEELKSGRLTHKVCYNRYVGNPEVI